MHAMRHGVAYGLCSEQENLPGYLMPDRFEKFREFRIRCRMNFRWGRLLPYTGSKGK